jgi:hypothetical protein
MGNRMCASFFRVLIKRKKTMENQCEAPMKRIHVIFKTHLDVGFTDLARIVTASYINHFIPQALQVAEQMRDASSDDRFVWTTGSWLIYEYLEQSNRDNRARMEKAIAAGDIAWHGLPFTTHSELMDAGLFRFGLTLAQELDARFTKRTIAAKMTDVPGHTIGIVPLLAEAGIQFLHIGVNPASTPPDVPPVFVWRSPQGADVIVMYHKGSYGDLMLVPGMDDAICFAHTGDNLGPQSPEGIRDMYRSMRARFPGVEVLGSTMDAFAVQLGAVKGSLPVLTQELGDTWIHGVGSDPKKVAHFLELQRLRARWLAEKMVDQQAKSFKAFSRFMLLVPEHTWGLDEKTHLADFEAYDAARFGAARGEEHFRRMETSWQEQRDYLRSAVEALDAPLAEQAHAALQVLDPQVPDARGMAMVRPGELEETEFFRLRFDAQTGALALLEDRRSGPGGLAGRAWADAQHPLGMFRYEAFAQKDYDRFYRQYVINKRHVATWAVPDFTKPGMDAAGPVARQEWLPLLVDLYRKAEASGVRYLVRMTMPEEASARFGCPRDVIVQMHFSSEQPVITIDLQWFRKQACRLPEAIWYSFIPAVYAPYGLRLRKMGQEISPLDVVKNGSRHLHAGVPGAFYQDDRGRLAIDSLDAPLIAPGERSLLDFHNRQPALAKGLHFLLYNNIWGTNFRMWYEEDARFRFTLAFNEHLGKIMNPEC